jgi:hypothetical protein
MPKLGAPTSIFAIELGGVAARNRGGDGRVSELFTPHKPFGNNRLGGLAGFSKEKLAVRLIDEYG